MDIAAVSGNCSKRNNNILFKAWQRCRSFRRQTTTTTSLTKSWSWPRNKSKREEMISTNKKNKSQLVAGCFAVYVGPQRRRFVVKTEYANHPLFAMLLNDAESEFEFNCDGPIYLPCDVALFYRVLAEMDCGDGEETMINDVGRSWSSTRWNPLILFSPRPRRPACTNSNSSSALDYGGAYRTLRASTLLKLNSGRF